MRHEGVNRPQKTRGPGRGARGLTVVEQFVKFQKRDHGVEQSDRQRRIRLQACTQSPGRSRERGEEYRDNGESCPELVRGVVAAVPCQIRQDSSTERAPQQAIPWAILQ